MGSLGDQEGTMTDEEMIAEVERQNRERVKAAARRRKSGVRARVTVPRGSVPPPEKEKEAK